MQTDRPKANRLATAASWLALLAALACLGFTAWFIPSDRQGYLAIFTDFQQDLPLPTRVMFAIPDLAFRGAALVVAVALVAAQVLLRGRQSVIMIYVTIIVFCCVALVAYRESLFRPLSSLIHRLTGG